MKKILLVALTCLCLAPLAVADEVEDRIVRGAVVLKEIFEAPDSGIPQDLIDKSVCVVVIPGMKKGGFIFGGNYGRGLMSCRTDIGGGPWSSPAMFRLEGGSFGLQIGAQSVDLVLMVMNLSGIESLLGNKFTLGGDASVAAGPVGRSAAAETDAWMSAKILAYSRTRGLFGGLIIKGGTMRPDKSANDKLYRQVVDIHTLLLQGTSQIPGVAGIPKDAQIFLDQLNKISPPKPAR
ncbi:MAG: lipid-binding SYLF domain-containing protein [Acidobacteriota bacterium]|jgi:lipid-binding SYLF domain-containing protein|nr:lipid-binding SYLF domain-containing protein [Acidobacteriota bacterium]